MSEQNLFEIFLNGLNFDVSEYFTLGDLTDLQKKVVEDAKAILKDNLVGDMKSFGGNLKKTEEKLKQFLTKAETELEGEKYKSAKKELKEMFKEYAKKLRELIAKSCLAIIPVKELPFVDVIFRSVPRIVIEKKKVNLLDTAIAYYGEIKCIISKTTIYGKIKDAKPLFAPYMGELDLGGYKLDPSQQKGPKSLIYPYIGAIIRSLDSQTARTQLAKYHEGYQRHGEPICDFLMKDEELLTAMEKVTSSLDAKRTTDSSAVCGIAIPSVSDKSTILIVVNEAKDSDKYNKCFEAALRFAAACCEAPSTSKGGAPSPSEKSTEEEGPSGPGVGGLVAPTAQAPGAMRTPGGQELKVWTEEELIQQAQQRSADMTPNMPSWTEEELAKASQERGSGIPDGMEVWTEEDLQELAKTRQVGDLNIPEWKAEEEMQECSKCGYSLRKGWTECPVCETPVGKAASKPAEQKPAQPTAARPPEQKPTKQAPVPAPAAARPSEQKPAQQAPSKPTEQRAPKAAPVPSKESGAKKAPESKKNSEENE